jgi:hypothetical protein
MIVRMIEKSRALSAVACALVVCATACGSGGEIPPPVPPPDPPKPKPPVHNDLGFEPHKEGEPFDTYRGLVMAGYQGWFGGPARKDGGSFGGEQWYHYREAGVFKPGVLQNSIDMWPDMSEYTDKYTPGVDGMEGSNVNTPSGKFMLPNGQPAQVYSAWDESTVRLHFKWMKEYGIDGVFMQRFVAEVVNYPSHARHFDRVLENAMKASNEYQRAICVMYDLGGFMDKNDPKKNVAGVLADTDGIVAKYNLGDRTKQKFYLHHNGKPLIVLWGVGFNDGRPYSLGDIEELVNGLRERGFSIMLGVPTYWRERRNDALSDPKLTALIKSADIIMPWFVGRFGDHNYVSGGFADLVKQDIEWCEDNKVDYAPLCYPGSSDRNMHPKNGLNPRLGGKFYWRQMHNCIAAGAKMLYIAMFDEIDEGTAIYKCLNQKDVPSNAGATDYWVYQRPDGSYGRAATEANIPSNATWKMAPAEVKKIPFTGIENDLGTDHYLWLTGHARKVLRGEEPMSSTLPVRP